MTHFTFKNKPLKSVKLSINLNIVITEPVLMGKIINKCSEVMQSAISTVWVNVSIQKIIALNFLVKKTSLD